MWQNSTGYDFSWEDLADITRLSTCYRRSPFVPVNTVLSLLSALFEKTGTGVDLIRLNQRKEVIRDWAVQREQEEEAALLQGRILDRSKASLPPDLKKSLRLPERWWPVLIVVPPTVYQNWQNELARFTHFSVACYDGNNKEKAVAQICSGMAEIMLAKKSTFEKGNYFKEINAMPVIWKLVVIDEFHTWKVRFPFFSHLPRPGNCLPSRLCCAERKD